MLKNDHKGNIVKLTVLLRPCRRDMTPLDCLILNSEAWEANVRSIIRESTALELTNLVERRGCATSWCFGSAPSRLNTEEELFGLPKLAVWTSARELGHYKKSS